MTSEKTVALTFVISVIIVVISVSWLIFHQIINVGLMFFDSINLFLLISGIISFIFLQISLHHLLVITRNKQKTIKDQERNVRDCYRYNALMNPPVEDMNN